MNNERSDSMGPGQHGSQSEPERTPDRRRRTERRSSARERTEARTGTAGPSFLSLFKGLLEARAETSNKIAAEKSAGSQDERDRLRHETEAQRQIVRVTVGQIKEKIAARDRSHPPQPGEEPLSKRLSDFETAVQQAKQREEAELVKKAREEAEHAADIEAQIKGTHDEGLGRAYCQVLIEIVNQQRTPSLDSKTAEKLNQVDLAFIPVFERRHADLGITKEELETAIAEAEPAAGEAAPGGAPTAPELAPTPAPGPLEAAAPPPERHQPPAPPEAPPPAPEPAPRSEETELPVQDSQVRQTTSEIAREMASGQAIINSAFSNAQTSLEQIEGSLKRKETTEAQANQQRTVISTQLEQIVNETRSFAQRTAQTMAQAPLGAPDFEAFISPENRIPRPEGPRPVDAVDRARWHEQYRQTLYRWFHEHLYRSMESQGGFYESHLQALTTAEATIIRFRKTENLPFLQLNATDAVDRHEIEAYHELSANLQRVLESRRNLQHMAVVWALPEAGLPSINSASGRLWTEHLATLFTYRTKISPDGHPEGTAVFAEAFRTVETVLNQNILLTNDQLRACQVRGQNALDELEQLDEDFFQGLIDQTDFTQRFTHIIGKYGLQNRVANRTEALDRLRLLRQQKEMFEHQGKYPTKDRRAAALSFEIKVYEAALKRSRDRIESIEPTLPREDLNRRWAYDRAIKALSVLGESARYDLAFFQGPGDHFLARLVRAEDWLDKEVQTSAQLSRGLYRGLDFGYRSFFEGDKMLGGLKDRTKAGLIAKLTKLGLRYDSRRDRPVDYTIKTGYTATGEVEYRVDHVNSLETANFEDDAFWEGKENGAFSSNIFKALNADASLKFMREDFLWGPENVGSLLPLFQHLKGAQYVKEGGRIVKRDGREIIWKQLVDRVVGWMGTKEGKQIYELSKHTPQIARYNYLESAASSEVIDDRYKKELINKYWGNPLFSAISRTLEIYLFPYRYPPSLVNILGGWVSSTFGRFFKYVTTGETR